MWKQQEVVRIEPRDWYVLGKGFGKPPSPRVLHSGFMVGSVERAVSMTCLRKETFLFLRLIKRKCQMRGRK